MNRYYKILLALILILLIGAGSVQAADGLQYGTLLGGPGQLDGAGAVTVDEAGNIYVTGAAYPGFPTTPGAFDTTIEGVFSDAYVAKFGPDGSLIYATYFGGSDLDTGHDIFVDANGEVYVSGYTTSPDFYTTPGAFDGTLDGESDGFVVKLNADGSDLIYATLLGGSGNEVIQRMAVDEGGHAYVVGSTDDFPTTPGVIGPTPQGGTDIYIAKLAPDGSDLIYATLLGGSDQDYGGDIALDGAGNAYLTGRTLSADFPVTAGAFDAEYNAPSDAFVAVLNNDGSALTYATYLGADDFDSGEAITVDGAGDIYVTGYTGSANFPTTPDAYQATYNGERDAFITKLNPTELIYSTFVGGSDQDYSHTIALQGESVYISGDTISTDFPTTANAFQTTHQGMNDTFVFRLEPGAAEPGYSSFVGGSNIDDGSGLALDAAGRFYLSGATASADFPVTPNAFDNTLEGFKDAFVISLYASDDSSTVLDHDCAPTGLGSIEVGPMPRGVAIDEGRGHIFVANYGGNSLSVIDGTTNAVIKTIPDIISPTGLAYDATQDLIWVTAYNVNWVLAIDAATLTTLPPAIPVGRSPWGVAHDPLHNRLYVANNGDDSVTVLDPASREVIATLSDDFDRPFHLAANPVTGKVYVANYENHTLTVIEDTSVSRVISLYDSLHPYDLAIDETRDLVYVTSPHTSRIVVIGQDQFYGWAAFYRGWNRAYPLPLRAIAINPQAGPDGGHLWTTVANPTGSNSQALFIPKGWLSGFHYPVVASDTGLTPQGDIAIDRTTNRLYISNGTTPGTVTVLGDHNNVCPLIRPAEAGEPFDFEVHSQTEQVDLTGDGIVDIMDLTFIASRYGSTDSAADLNADGIVDIFDLALVAASFGR